MLESGGDTAGMIPKVRVVPARRCDAGVAGPHPRRPTPHAMLLEIFTRRRSRHHGDADMSPDVTEPPVTRRTSCHTTARRRSPSCAARGAVLWDERGQGVSRLPLGGLAVTSLGHPIRRSPTRSGQPAATLLHVSNLFGTPSAEVAATIDLAVDSSGGGRVFFRQQRSGGERSCHQAGPQVGWRGCHVVVSAYGSVPRSDPGHAACHRPARQARALRRRSRRLQTTSPGDDIEALAGAIDPSGGRRPARARAGRGRRESCRRGLFPAR